MDDKDKPQFSRNLEIDNSPLDRRTQARGGETGQGPVLSAEEKSLYFRVEGEKVLQMLSLELSRPEPDPSSILLLKDLHRTWRTLWRGDDSFPVGPFTEMFELAFSILSSVVLLGRKVSLDERLMLDNLNQDMVRLVSGAASLACLESCRRLIEKVAPVAEKLKEESMGWSEKALRLNPDGDRATERGAVAGKTAGEGAKADITSSVDEWFDQVTRLMVQPLPPEGAAARPRLEGRDAGPVVRQTGEKRPDVGQIGLFSGERNAVKQPEKSPVGMARPDKSPSAHVEKSTPTAAPVKQPPAPPEALPQVPVSREVKDVVSPAAGKQQPPRPKASPVAPVSDATNTAVPQGPAMTGIHTPLSPAPIGKTQSAVQGQSGGIAASRPVEPPEEVLNYFRELSVITLEVLNHNLADISGTSARREVRLVVSYLDDLLGAARDFGLESRVPPLESLRESLQQAAAGGQTGQPADRLYRRAAEFAEKLSGSLN